MLEWKEIQKERRLAALFAGVMLLLIGMSAATLIYLNHTFDRLSDSLYHQVYENTENLLSADRDLYQASLALLQAANPKNPPDVRAAAGGEFRANIAQVRERVGSTARDLPSATGQAVRLGGSEKLPEALAEELQGFGEDFRVYAAMGEQALASFPDEEFFTPDGASALLNAQLERTRGYLDRGEQLLDSYAQRITQTFHDRKSGMFAVYTLLLCLLMLVILYLGRKLILLHKEMRDSQSMYQLIGKSMSDFILLTDGEGRIGYASPSHASVLGYVPDKGDLLTNYIREPELSWAKLKAAVHSASRLSELRMRAETGRWVWLETKVTPITGSRSFPVRYMFVSREITERKQHEERLHKLAFYDHLTSIPNRAHFKMYMESLTSNPGSGRTPLALALLDCDRFKQLNDTLGHLAGDDFLQQLSRELQQAVQGSGQAFRLGGDEFAVVLHRRSAPESLEHSLSKLLRLFHKTWSVDGASFHTSASIGVALYPEHGVTMNELLKAADLAMYRSKSQGGNEACLYDESMREAEQADEKSGG